MKTIFTLLISLTQLSLLLSHNTTTVSNGQDFILNENKLETFENLTQITEFGASLYKGIVVLKWSTNDELNCKGFTIQRAGKDKKWHSIGFVKSASDQTSVFSTNNTYSFVDKQPMIGLNAYRLVQMDINGMKQYSKVATVVKTQPPSNKVQIIAYPNPTSNGYVKLAINNLQANILKIYVMGPNGKLVSKYSSDNVIGSFQKLLVLPDPGVYQIYVQLDDAMYLRKVVVQK